MDENLFTIERVGRLEWVDKGIPAMYYRFQPKPFPFDYKPSEAIDIQSEKTLLALGNLDGMAKKLSPEEVSIIQYILMLKEATISSEIEGVKTTITNVFKEEKVKEPDIEKRRDNEEARNYFKALEYGLNNDLTEETIKQMHKILLEGVRGSGKNPGEYKINQNAVGRTEDDLHSAKFVPASPESVPDLMKNFMEFTKSSNRYRLYKIAICHYQFEAIHPFRDGNGRLGRLLIMLQICKEAILKNPLLYISEYFNRNRDPYTELLFNVSSKGDIESWTMFFLKALELQAEWTMKILNKLSDYRLELHKKSEEISQSPKMYYLVEHLFRQPFIDVGDVMKVNGISQPGAWHLIQKLIGCGILKEVVRHSKKKVYVAHKIIEIIEAEASA